MIEELEKRFDTLAVKVVELTAQIASRFDELVNRIEQHYNVCDYQRKANTYRDELIKRLNEKESELVAKSKSDKESKDLCWLKTQSWLHTSPVDYLLHYVARRNCFYSNEFTIYKKFFYHDLFRSAQREIDLGLLLGRKEYKRLDTCLVYLIGMDQNALDLGRPSVAKLLYFDEKKNRLVLMDEKMKVVLREMSIRKGYTMTQMHVRNGGKIYIELERTKKPKNSLKIYQLDPELRVVNWTTLQKRLVSVAFASNYILAFPMRTEFDQLSLIGYSDLVEVDRVQSGRYYSPVDPSVFVNFHVLNLRQVLGARNEILMFDRPPPPGKETLVPKKLEFLNRESCHIECSIECDEFTRFVFTDTQDFVYVIKWGEDEHGEQHALVDCYSTRGQFLFQRRSQLFSTHTFVYLLNNRLMSLRIDVDDEDDDEPDHDDDDDDDDDEDRANRNLRQRKFVLF